MPKQKSWWLQNVGTKNGPECPLCKKHAGCKCKHSEKITRVCAYCSKKKCKGDCRPTPTRHQPARVGSHKPTGKGTPVNPGKCGCGAYLFPNGKCRDITCSNY